jgi:hypothetical protein
MNIQKLKLNPIKLEKLLPTELENVIQYINNEIENYKELCKNYSADKHEKISVPYINSWEEFKTSALFVLKRKYDESSLA